MADNNEDNPETQRAKALLAKLSPTQINGFRSSLSDLPGMSPKHLQEFVTSLLKMLSSEEMAALPYIFDQRSGRNLGGFLSEYASQGWGGGYNSLFRKVAKAGFDMTVQQGNGRYPVIEAFRCDIDNLIENDIKFAMRCGFDPLAYFPYVEEGESLLSLELADYQEPLITFISDTVERHLNKLPREQRIEKIELLRPTAIAAYTPLFSKMTRELLHDEAAQNRKNGTRQKTAKSLNTPRF